MSRNLFEEACADIDENLWVLSPAARTRIKGWFMAIDRGGYERGLAHAGDRENVEVRVRASEISEGLQTGVSDDLFEMANLDRSDTGIEGIVYVSTPQGSHAPRVKWYPGRSGRRAPCLSVTISPTPEARNHNLPQATADRMSPIVSQWVTLNHAALMTFWQQGASWTRQEVNAHFDGLQKLGLEEHHAYVRNCDGTSRLS